MAYELESDLRDTADWYRKWLVDFNAGKTQVVLLDRSSNPGVIDVKIDRSVLEKNAKFKMVRLTFSSKLDWGSHISIAKDVSKKIGILKFLSPEVALYLNKSTIRPCMEYIHGSHVWAGASSYYLESLDKLLKRICSTVGPSRAASPEPLAHRRSIVTSTHLFYRYYFGRCSCELAQLVPLPYFRDRSTRYCDRLHNFSITILRCY